MKILDFNQSIFLTQDRSGKWHFIYVISGLSLVKFYLLDPSTMDFFIDFHWDMSENLINIYNLRYNTVVLKKVAKTFTNCSFRTLFGQKTRPAEAMPKIKFNFFLEITKGDYKLSRTFYFIKNHNFWLSYEWFYVLYDILLPKPVISPAEIDVVYHY